MIRCFLWLSVNIDFFFYYGPGILCIYAFLIWTGFWRSIIWKSRSSSCRSLRSDVYLIFDCVLENLSHLYIRKVCFFYYYFTTFFFMDFEFLLSNEMFTRYVCGLWHVKRLYCSQLNHDYDSGRFCRWQYECINWCAARRLKENDQSVRQRKRMKKKDRQICLQMKNIVCVCERETDDGEWTRKTFMVFMSNSTIYVRNLIYTFIYFSTVTVLPNVKWTALWVLWSAGKCLPTGHSRDD